MTISVYVATSLDGYIAASDGGLEWLNEIPNPEGSDYGFAAFMSGIDAVVMGRVTFDQVLGFGVWPYEKPVFVLSRSLERVPEATVGKVELIQGHPQAIVEQLRDRGHDNLYVDDGRTIQGFLEADLVDELILTHVPILLGDGVPLFGKMASSRKFTVKKTERLNDQLVKNHYVRVRD